LSDGDLALALTAVGCTPDQDGQWHPPVGVGAPYRYRAIVTLAAGRDLTRAEMIDVPTGCRVPGEFRDRADEFVSSGCSGAPGLDTYRLVGTTPVTHVKMRA
jgi:hypothetical protein